MCSLPKVMVSLQSRIPSKKVEGHVLLTTQRILFLANTTAAAVEDSERNTIRNEPKEKEEENAASVQDFCMDAQCIALHAMTSDPESTVYCQISDGVQPRSDPLKAWFDDDNKDEKEDDEEWMEGPMEVFFSPRGTNDVNAEMACQQLFDGMSRLATLNPILEEDDENQDHAGYGSFGGGGGGGGGSLAAMMGLMGSSSRFNPMDMEEEGGDGEEMIVRMDHGDIVTTTTTAGNANANPFLQPIEGEEEEEDQRRNQVLERLDNMLVVPPELEIQPGQFDDAESDTEEEDPLL